MHVGRGSADSVRKEMVPHLRETAAAIEADLTAGQPSKTTRR
jgi:hypothetical protein